VKRRSAAAAPPVAPASPKRRCAIYTRKSTTHGLDQEFSSLDAQWEACAGYVKGQPGWELVEDRYDDGGFTGANLERPAFQRLMADVEAGKIDVVVVYKIDRLSRSLLDFASLMERFRKVGAYFVSVTQPFLSADSDAMAQLLLNVLISFAQFERQMIAERIRDKVVASRRRGIWTGGNVPFGYRIEGRKLLPDPAEAAVVLQMVEAYERDHSDCALTRELAARNIATRKGRPWTPQSVARVLTSPVYAGYITLGDELHEGEHEPLVERERFERLQELRAAKEGPGCHRDHAKGQRNPEYLLRGILFCACTHDNGSACGYAMTPSSTRKGATVHRYYRCIARNKVAVSACPARPLAAKTVEGLVRQQVVEVARRLDEKGRKEGSTVDAAVARHSGRRIHGLKARRQELRLKLDERERELAGVDEEGGDTPNRLTKRHGEPSKLREELRSVQAQLGHLEQLVLSGAWIAEQLRALEQVWDRLLPINRLRVVRSLVERVDVDSTTGEVRVTLKDWVSEALTGKAQGHAA
jgi:DNA invertase Pin-like site-specific DNA recombinase